MKRRYVEVQVAVEVDDDFREGLLVCGDVLEEVHCVAELGRVSLDQVVVQQRAASQGFVRVPVHRHRALRAGDFHQRELVLGRQPVQDFKVALRVSVFLEFRGFLYGALHQLVVHFGRIVRDQQENRNRERREANARDLGAELLVQPLQLAGQGFPLEPGEQRDEELAEGIEHVLGECSEEFRAAELFEDLLDHAQLSEQALVLRQGLQVALQQTPVRGQAADRGLFVVRDLHVDDGEADGLEGCSRTEPADESEHRLGFLLAGRLLVVFGENRV